MKRKALLFIAIIAVLICALAMTVSAKHEYTELDESALTNLDVKITLTDGTNEFDTMVKFKDLFNYELTTKTDTVAYALKLKGIKATTVTVDETEYTLKTSMTAIYFPDGITHLNTDFMKNYSTVFSKACLPDSIEFIGDNVFYRCGTFSFIDEAGALDNYLPENLTVIANASGSGSDHFLSGCALQNSMLIFPEGLTNFGCSYSFNDGFSQKDNMLILVFLGKMTNVNVGNSIQNSAKFRFYFANNSASDAIVTGSGNVARTVETRLIDDKWAYAFKSSITGVDASTETDTTGKTLTINISNNDPNSASSAGTYDNKSWYYLSSQAPIFYFCSGEKILTFRHGAFGYQVYASNPIEATDVHPFEDSGVLVEPTCLIGGGMRYSCGVCGTFIRLEEQTAEALGHDYTEEDIVATTPLTCTQDKTTTYLCKRCDEEFVVINEQAQGHIYSIVTYPVEATLTSLGIKKTQCENCTDYLEFEYRIDPGDSMTTVILGDGTVFEIKSSDLFNYTFDEVAQTAIISSLKSTSFVIGEKEFSTSEIHTVRVPFGFTGIGKHSNVGIEVMDFSLTEDFIIGSETFRDNHTIEWVILGNNTSVLSDAFRCPLSFKGIIVADGASVMFPISVSIFNDIRSDIEIIIGKNATVHFARENFTSGNVDARLVNLEIGDGSTVVFGRSSFNDLTTLKNIKIGENCNLSFGEYSFEDSTTLESLIFPASTTVTLSANAFKNCTALKEIFLPSSITSIPANAFVGCTTLESVALMGVTSIGENAFNATTDKTLTIFSHANGDLSINSSAFANRANVVLYTTSTNVTSLSTTSYTIYSGIPHSQYKAKLDPTCTEDGYDGYATVCPCGAIVSEVTYTIYATDAEPTSGSYGIHTVIPNLGGHTDKVVILYANGFDKEGSKSVACAVCSEVLSEATIVNPIFVHEGYSYKLNGTITGIQSAFKVNKEELEAYETASEKKLTFGMIIANPTYLGDTFFTNGKVNADKGAIQVQVDIGDYSVFSCYISGFQKIDPQVNLELVIAGYVYEGDDTSSLKLMQKTYEVGDEAPIVSKVTKGTDVLHTVNIANVKAPVALPSDIKEFGSQEQE